MDKGRRRIYGVELRDDLFTDRNKRDASEHARTEKAHDGQPVEHALGWDFRLIWGIWRLHRELMRGRRWAWAGWSGMTEP